MKTFVFILFLFASSITFANASDSKIGNKETEKTSKIVRKIRKDSKKTARLYRRANSRINKELYFRTSSDIKTA